MALTVAALAAGLQANGLVAQQEAEEDLDRVVAVVGDSVVLLSQILQREAEMRAQGSPIPSSPVALDQFRRTLLDDLVDNQILLQAAALDTLLQVDDSRVDDALQQRIASTEQAFGGREEMQTALRREGLSIQVYREMMREQIRQQQLVGQYISRRQAPNALQVSQEEMQNFFEEQRASIQQRPATVTFKQVVLAVAPSLAADSTARATADSLLARARAGEDFAELATEYSQDPGSARAGGDLGWFRRVTMADEFEDAAFNLLDGEISEVIETPFGYHIIRVDQIRFAQRRARHILIQPQIGPQDVERTRELASEIAERAASEPIEPLIEEHHDPFMPDSATIPLAQMDQMLSPEYGKAILGRSAGDIVGPVQFNYRSQERFAVIKLIERRDAGEYTFEDLEEQIRTSLMQQKRVEAIVEELRRKIHIELKVN